MRNWLASTVGQQALLVAVVLLSASSLAGLLTAQHSAPPTRSVGSPSPVALATPSPKPEPAASPPPPSGPAVQLSAPSTNVVWALVDDGRLYRSVDQGAQWEQRPIPADFGVHPVVSFLDDHEGWLLAPGSPTTGCEEAPAAVWHTTDAGTTWRQLPARSIAAAQCKDGIWFFDTRRGFVAAHDTDHRPTLYRTSDGGATWAAVTIADPAYYRSQPGGSTLKVVWMKRFGATLYLEVYGTQDDPNLPHDNQFVLRSTDGGATWVLVTKTLSTSVVMVTESRWLDLVNPGFSYESVNGGQAFAQFASDFNTDARDATRFVFADSLVGYASGAGLLQRTVDGGAHWTRLATPGAAPSPAASPSPIPLPAHIALSAPSTNVVWALVAGQHMFRSTDQGKTWNERTAPPHPGGGGDPLIAFVDDTNGWVLLPEVPATQCQQQGVQLWRTTDGATSWKLVSIAQFGQVSPHGFELEQCKEAIHFADAMHGFVAASDPLGELVYRTADGGLTWSASQLPNPPGFQPGAGRLEITSLKSFGSTVLLYAAPYVFGSFDGGSAWRFMTREPQTESPQLNFLTPTHWLKLRAGLETTDAGASWNAFTYHDVEPIGVPSDFVFVDGRVGYATSQGDIRLTIDGGADFVLIKSSWP